MSRKVGRSSYRAVGSGSCARLAALPLLFSRIIDASGNPPCPSTESTRQRQHGLGSPGSDIRVPCARASPPMLRAEGRENAWRAMSLRGSCTSVSCGQSPPSTRALTSSPQSLDDRHAGRVKTNIRPSLAPPSSFAISAATHCSGARSGYTRTHQGGRPSFTLSTFRRAGPARRPSIARCGVADREHDRHIGAFPEIFALGVRERAGRSGRRGIGIQMRPGDVVLHAANACLPDRGRRCG